MWPGNITLSVINAENAEAQRRRGFIHHFVTPTITAPKYKVFPELQNQPFQNLSSAPLRLCVSNTKHKQTVIPHTRARQNGFTLLELVVVIIIISILGLFALDRFWSLRVAAERAAVQQVVGNIRSALGLEVARYALENRLAELPRLDGSNPMPLLAQTPRSYLGELSPDPATLAEGSWYFDPTTKTLNYRVTYRENFSSPADESAWIRWRITLIYRDRNHNQRFDPGLDAISGLDLVRLAH